MVDHKTNFQKRVTTFFAIVFSTLVCIFLQNCYLFCLFKQDQIFEKAVEHWIEEEVSGKLDETLFSETDE